MRIAVANSDFQVALLDEKLQVPKLYQVANGEDLRLRSGRMAGVSREGAIAGYLMEIEGRIVFIDERLMEVSE